MPSRIAAAAAVVALAGPAWGRDICIRPSMMGMDYGYGARIDHCHVICFTKPKEAVARYETAQKDRFEKPDPATIDHLSQTILVSVTMTEGGRDPVNGGACRSAGAPEKLVLAKDGTPVLVIPLKAEEITIKNAMGATFAAYDGTGEMAVTDMNRLTRESDLDLHLVLQNYVQKETWRNDWAEKLLKK
jgi:hypothetical protein